MTEPSPRPSNKRRSRRNPSRATTRLRIYRNSMGLGPNVATTLLDLSDSGLRAVLKEAATLGQEVEVNLESAATGLTIKSTATVVWIVPATDGTFVVGLHLQKSLSYGDFLALTRH